MKNFEATIPMESYGRTLNAPDFVTFATGGRVFFHGTNAVSKNYNIPLKLTSSNNISVKPSLFSHLDENVFIGGHGNSLMSPTLGYGEVIHDIGNIALGVMKDIGWDVNYITYNLDVQIGKMAGTSFTTSGISTTLCEGDNYTYAVSITPNNGSTVTIPAGNVTWYLFAYHTGGKENVLTTSSTSNILTNKILTLKNPLSSSPLNWIYNPDGTILGELRVICKGSDNINYTSAIRVSISTKPGQPVISQYCCNGKAYVSFPASGAVYYKIYPAVPAGSFTTTTATSLLLNAGLYKIGAVNAAGCETKSAQFSTIYCGTIICNPDGTPINPDLCAPQSSRLSSQLKPETTKDEPVKIAQTTTDYMRIIISAEDLQISGYKIRVVSLNGNELYINDISDSVTDIPIVGWAKGIYIVSVYSNSVELYSRKILIR